MLWFDIVKYMTFGTFYQSYHPPYLVRETDHHLLSFDYEGNLHRSVDDVRKELNFEAPPPIFN
eukprot:gene27928-34715_t